MRAWIVVLCIVLACEKRITLPPVRRTRAATDDAAQRFAAAASRGDAATIEKMLPKLIVLGGVWFADAECRKQFGQPVVVPGSMRAALAKCLATLHLEVSSRQHAFDDMALFTYPPGIELEAWFFVRRISGIGFVSRDSNGDALPTITPSMLDSLRADRDPPPSALADRLASDLTVTRRDHAFAWLRLCLDASGEVTVQARDSSSSVAEQVFTEVARGWKFNPMMLDGRPTAVCSLVRLVYPAGKGSPRQIIPPAPALLGTVPNVVVESQRIAGEKSIVPDDDTKAEIQKSGYRQTVTSVKVCLDETGRVVNVQLIKSGVSARYDDTILRVIANEWRYRPYLVEGKPTPVCTAVTFIYSQH